MKHVSMRKFSLSGLAAFLMLAAMLFSAPQAKAYLNLGWANVYDTVPLSTSSIRVYWTQTQPILDPTQQFYSDGWTVAVVKVTDGIATHNFNDIFEDVIDQFENRNFFETYTQVYLNQGTYVADVPNLDPESRYAFFVVPNFSGAPDYSYVDSTDCVLGVSGPNALDPVSWDSYADYAMGYTFSHIQLHWDSDPSMFFDRYEVYRRVSGTNDWTLVTTITDPSQTSYWDGGSDLDPNSVQDNTYYDYVVWQVIEDDHDNEMCSQPTVYSNTIAIPYYWLDYPM